MTLAPDRRALVSRPSLPPTTAVPPGRRPFRLSPHWPLTALLVGFPIWWALGLSEFVFAILAVPMVLHLARRRPIRLPRGFALWALFLLWTVVSAVALSWHAPGTLQGSAANRILGYGLRLANYLAQTVVLLYVGNLSERELPRARLVRMLGFFFLVTVAGGLLGVAAPHFSFTSPFELLLPHSLRDNGYVTLLVHPASSQYQSILGYGAARPKAPFDYTNTWGGNLAVLLVFFVLGWWTWGTPRRRLLAVGVLLVALVPIVYSVDRGLWLALGGCVLYVALRLAWRGRRRALVGLVVVLAAAGVVVLLSPLHTIITDRIAHPKSNSIRTDLSGAAYQGALSSPVLGYGSDRQIAGSNQSIAVGKSSTCTQCGNFGVGSNGQFWLTLFSQGFVGVALYTLFFLVVFWRSWRDRSPIGDAGTLVLLLSLFFNLIYPGAGVGLELYMIAAGLLWRNEQAGRLGLPGSPARPTEVPA